MGVQAMKRDYQVSRVYSAEQLFRWYLDQVVENPVVQLVGSSFTLPPEAKFSTPETVQAYVDRVLTHPEVVERYGKTSVKVRERRGTTHAHYEGYGPHGGVIAVPDAKWSLREIVILHELAHHFDRSFGPSHGPRFVATFLDIVGVIMGVQAELVLQILFRDNGVEVN